MVLPAFSGRLASSRAACTVAPGRDAGEDSLFGAEAAGHRDRLGDVDVDDLVVDLAVEDRGHEVGADALDLVRAGGASVEDRRLLGLDRHDAEAGLLLLEVVARARDRAARADARRRRCRRRRRCPPRSRGPWWRGGWRGWPRSRTAWPARRPARSATISAALLDGALHALAAGGEDELGTVGASRVRRSIAIVSGMVRTTL